MAAKENCVHPRVPAKLHAEMGSVRPNEQAKKIPKPILILLTAAQSSENFHEWRIIGLTFRSSSIRIPQFVCLRTLGFASLPYMSGSIGSTFPYSRQDLERWRVTLSYFVS